MDSNEKKEVIKDNVAEVAAAVEEEQEDQPLPPLPKAPEEVEEKAAAAEEPSKEEDVDDKKEEIKEEGREEKEEATKEEEEKVVDDDDAGEPSPSAPEEDTSPPIEEFDSSKLSPGASIFYETFRRADKNDDGHLSMQEFKSYFKDPTVTYEQLEDLFNEIDVDGNHNIEIDELLKYFIPSMLPYQGLFTCLENLQKQVQSALLMTANRYPNLGLLEQFHTRFFLKEAAVHLNSLINPLEAAVTHLDSHAYVADEEHRHSSRDVIPNMDRVEAPAGMDGDGLKTINMQMSRIERFLARVERSVFGSLHINMVDNEYLEAFRDEDDSDDDDTTESGSESGNGPHEFIDEESHVLLLRDILVIESEIDVFRKHLFRYIRKTKQHLECHQLYVKAGSDMGSFYVYELWEHESALSEHQRGNTYKEFAKAAIDFYARPEQSKTMPLPSSWVS